MASQGWRMLQRPTVATDLTLRVYAYTHGRMIRFFAVVLLLLALPASSSAAPRDSGRLAVFAAASGLGQRLTDEEILRIFPWGE